MPHSPAIASALVMMLIGAVIKAVVHAHLFAFRSPKPIIRSRSPNQTPVRATHVSHTTP